MTETSLTEAEVRQLFRELGEIKERLASGSENHARFERTLEAIREELLPLPAVVATVQKMEPIVKDYEQNKWKVAGMFMVLSMLFGVITSYAKEICRAFTA